MSKNTIFHKQNEALNLKLLAAQRQLYSEAKSINNWQALIVFTTAIVTPILAHYLPDFNDYWGLLGLLLGGISFGILRNKAATKVEQATKVQEMFDTQVFDLPKNEALTGGDIGVLIWNKANKRHGQNEEKRKQLENWYPDTSVLEPNVAILASQRANLSWDWRLRKYYVERFLNIFIILFLLITVGFSIWQEQLLLRYLLDILAPTLPLLFMLYETREKHQAVWKRQELKQREIDQALKKHHSGKEKISMIHLRSFQDAIFKNRKENALVPDMVYGWIQTDYEADMDTEIKEILRRKQIQ